MRKVAGAIVLVILPILFVIGIMRVTSGADVSFLPDYKTFVNRMATAPDLYGDVRDAFGTWQTTYARFAFDVLNVHDIGSFFSAIGSFFNMVGNVFIIGFKFIAIPFRAAWWWIETLFVWSTSLEPEASSLASA